MLGRVILLCVRSHNPLAPVLWAVRWQQGFLTHAKASSSWDLMGNKEMMLACDWGVVLVCFVIAQSFWGLCAFLTEVHWYLLQIVSKCYCSEWSSLNNSFSLLLQKCAPTLASYAVISSDLISRSGMGGISVWMRDHEMLVQVIFGHNTVSSQ